MSRGHDDDGRRHGDPFDEMADRTGSGPMFADLGVPAGRLLLLSLLSGPSTHLWGTVPGLLAMVAVWQCSRLIDVVADNVAWRVAFRLGLPVQSCRFTDAAANAALIRAAIALGGYTLVLSVELADLPAAATRTLLAVGLPAVVVLAVETVIVYLDARRRRARTHGPSRGR